VPGHRNPPNLLDEEGGRADVIKRLMCFAVGNEEGAEHHDRMADAHDEQMSTCATASAQLMERLQ
jgi:hypothetical protein